ncbi:6024_t:CDS:2 [Dentiscutata erythropus]|uniref:6024_t:CDS:1 n=1 Tax=Dentiscutata erythropus TaxID=1348616 RepID=A0A9N9NCG7_9GLOM|nr:6024_t:CDS:2 [Dentiscutata erythropus]
MENLHNIVIKEYVSIILFERSPRNIWISKRINSKKEFYNHLQCPGGHVEVSYISAKQVAQRELLKKTGIKVRLQDLEYERTNHYYRMNEWRIVHIYFLRTKRRPTLTEPEEMIKWKIMNVQDIIKEPVIDSLKDTFKGRQNETRIIMIEGTCEAGKSTLAQMCKKYFINQRKSVKVIDETFITKDLRRRIINYKENLKKYKEEEIKNKPDILIMNRNLFSTIIFMDMMGSTGIYPKEEQQITCENNKYWEYIKRDVEVIWWNTPVEESIKRLICRGRVREIDIDYYRSLDQAYKKCMFEIYPNMKIITKETLLIVEQLKEFLPNILNKKIIKIEY